MRTTDYSDVLRGSAALAGLQVSDLSPAELGIFRTAHDRRLQVAWESHRWPEICTYEQRSFRAPWSATTAYVAANEVLDIATLTYFQALQPSTNQPPTTYVAGNGYTVNSAYWAQSMLQYTADDYQPGGTYALESQVHNPADGLFYQLFQTQELVAGAGYGGANGTFTVQFQVSGATAWGNGTLNLYWDPTGYWVLGTIAGSSQTYYAAPTPAVNGLPAVPPDQATGWYSCDNDYNPIPDNNPPPTVTVLVPAPPEPTCWGLLTPFNRYVAFDQAWETNAIAEFLAAWDFNPLITTKVQTLKYTISADGAQFTTLKHVPGYVWLLIRRVRPELTGGEYDATASYGVGQQVYYVNAGGVMVNGTVTMAGVGNFYTCAAASTANQNPETNPGNWVQIQIPYTFRQYLIQGGYADWLTGDGQTDKATAVETVAEQMLEFECDKLQRQQQQVNRLTWKTL